MTQPDPTPAAPTTQAGRWLFRTLTQQAGIPNDRLLREQIEAIEAEARDTARREAESAQAGMNRVIRKANADNEWVRWQKRMRDLMDNPPSAAPPQPSAPHYHNSGPWDTKEACWENHAQPLAPQALDVETLAKALDELSEEGLEYDLMTPEEREERYEAAEGLAAEYARLSRLPSEEERA